MCGAPQNVIDTDLGSTRHRHAGYGVTRWITSRNRFAADTTSIEARPGHRLVVPERILTGHELSGIVKGDGPTHDILGGGRTDRSILLNDLHRARGSDRVGEASHETSSIDGDVPDIIVHPAFEIGKKRAG